MFDHVEIHVSDHAASRAFYGEASGLPTFEGELVEWGEAVHHDGSRAGEIDHLWLRTSDVAAAKRFYGPPRSTTSGDASAVSCTPTPPAMRSPAIASARCVGTCGSSVRTRTFSRITRPVFHAGQLTTGRRLAAGGENSHSIQGFDVQLRCGAPTERVCRHDYSPERETCSGGIGVTESSGRGGGRVGGRRDFDLLRPSGRQCCSAPWGSLAPIGSRRRRNAARAT